MPIAKIGIFLGESVKLSHQKKEQLLKLIIEGEALDDRDLEAMYRWINDSHEALGFNPLQKHRFDVYCRSSSDCNAARIYVGVWMLRLALEESSTGGSDRMNLWTLSESAPLLPGKEKRKRSTKR
jgi:hypothetical protein